MRILYHHRTLGDGAEGIHIAEITDALRRLGHEVALVCPGGGSTAEEVATQVESKSRRLEWIKRHIPKYLFRIAEILYNIRSYWAVKKGIRQHRPVIMYERYACFSFGGLLAAKRARLPVILEVNTPYATAWDIYDRLYFKRLAREIEEYVFLQADAIITVSTALKNVLVKQGVPESKILVLPNGANPEEFDPSVDGTMVRRRYGVENRMVVGFVGILRSWHGVDLLFRAFTDVCRNQEKLHLLIVGNGPLEDTLKRQAERLGIADRVTFCGRVRHKEVPSHIAAMDIAVSPRAASHASPMKILEYMAMGTPTIAPRMLNVEDLIDDGISGILFNPEDPDSLAHCLRMLAEDADFRREIGRNARWKIEKRLNWTNNARAVLERAQSLRCVN